MGDYSHLKNKKGEFIAKPLPQPTLPNLSVDDDDDLSSMHTRGGPAPSTYTYTQDQYYYNSDKNDYPPPMPAYNPYSTHQPPGSYAHFNQSQNTFAYEESVYNNYPPQQQVYDDDYDSNAHLPMGAAPLAQQSQPSISRPGTAAPLSNPHSPGYDGAGNYDPHDVYQGRAAPDSHTSRRQSPPASSDARSSGGLAYDDPQDHGTLYATPNAYSGYSSYPNSPNAAQPQQPPPSQQRHGASDYSEDSGGGRGNGRGYAV